MGGYRYKSEEDNSLQELIKDNPAKSDSELARMACRYSICPNRTEKALIQRIGILRNLDTEKTDNYCVDGSHGMRDFLLMKADRDKCSELLDEIIIDVLIGTATLYEGVNRYGNKYNDLTYNIPAIRHYLWTHYDDLMNEKIDMLKAGKGAE